MGENKYSKVLTVILVVVVIAVVGLITFLGYDIYKDNKNKKETTHALEEFEEIVTENEGKENIELPEIEIKPTENLETTNKGETNKTNKKIQFKGYNVEGKIEIPAINLEYPILEKTTPSSIEQSVAIMYTENGLNKPGNTVIVGHNYRSGAFFGKNDRLKEGDKVYIKDNSGNRLKYNIYNIYETSPDDSDFIRRDTKGKREISLQTCTNNSKGRLVIWAVEE